jgi:hypothetical protein
MRFPVRGHSGDAKLSKTVNAGGLWCEKFPLPGRSVGIKQGEE